MKSVYEISAHPYIAAQFTIPNIQIKTITDDWIKKEWHTEKMEYYSVMKKMKS